MNRIQQKLRSKGGMTILIALVGFLAAAMVSVVIATAAATSAQRVGNDTKETQAHLTLTSAAQVVKADLEKASTKYKFTEFTTDATGKEIIDTTTHVTDSEATIFAGKIAQAVAAVQSGSDFNSATASPVASFTIELNDDSSEDDDEKQTVEVSFIMKGGDGEKYDIIFTLKTTNPKDEIYITADGFCTTEKDSDGNYSVSWQVKSVSRLSGQSSNSTG